MYDCLGRRRTFVGIERNLEMIRLVPGYGVCIGGQGNPGWITGSNRGLKRGIIRVPEADSVQKEKLARFDHNSMHDAEGAQAHQRSIEQHIVLYEIGADTLRKARP